MATDELCFQFCNNVVGINTKHLSISASQPANCTQNAIRVSERFSTEYRYIRIFIGKASVLNTVEKSDTHTQTHTHKYIC